MQQINATIAPQLSNFAAYILERENKFIIEDERGFMTYLFLPEYCYIEDVYVRPEFRKTGVASRWADRVAAEARERGYTKLLGTVSPKANGSTESALTLIAYGFRLHDSDEKQFYFIKQI